MILYLVVWLTFDVYTCANPWQAQRECEKQAMQIEFYRDMKVALKRADNLGGRVFKINSDPCSEGLFAQRLDCTLEGKANENVQELQVIPTKSYEVIESSYPVKP